MDEMIMRFMGTGAGEGVPTPFCRCRVCEHARKVGGKETGIQGQLSRGRICDFTPDCMVAILINGGTHNDEREQEKKKKRNDFYAQGKIVVFQCCQHGWTPYEKMPGAIWLSIA